MRKLYVREDVERELRSKIGKADGQMSQKQLADKWQIDKSVISRFLRGGFGLRTIAEKLGYDRIEAFDKKKTENEK